MADVEPARINRNASPPHGVCQLIFARASDLARAAQTILMRLIADPSAPGGTYHFSNSGVISWYDFAVAIRDLSGLQCRVQPIPSSQYPTPAKRPAYSVMDTTKIFSTFKLAPKPWRESLIRCLDKL